MGALRRGGELVVPRAAPGMMLCGEQLAVACELCGAAAEVHCEADAAFLCAGCDAKVHSANFLASRHRRRRVAWAGKGEAEEEDGASASSCCMSSADSATATTGVMKRRRMRAPKGKSRARGEAVLEGWAKRMGLQAGAARRRAAAAGRALRARGRGVAAAGVPLRVAMAAALWWEVAAEAVVHPADTLQRLEACAHVPARVIVAVAASMGRARESGPPAAVHAEEGCDECP